MESSEWRGIVWRAKARPGVACALLVAATTIAFWPVTQAGFINYDDPEYITENARVQAGLSWSGAAWALGTHYASNWHPLTWLSHMLDVTLFGNGAAGPHCVNLLLHTLNAVLLFLWLRRMTGAHWRSFLVAALFALHPLHVESVAWVAERKDVLSTLFWMLTLLAYARYVQESRVQSLKSRVWYGLALVCFALGLMSKPMLVTLPFVLVLLDYWPLGRLEIQSPKSKVQSQSAEPGVTVHASGLTFHVSRITTLPLLREKIPFFLLSAISCAVTMLAQSKAMLPLAGLSLGSRTTNALVSYGRYLGKAFWPAGLAVPYPHPAHWPEGQIALSALLVVGLCAAAGWGGRRWPFLFTGGFWFLGTLIPVIGLVQVGSQAMADRYTYVPLIGILLIVVWGAVEVGGRWRWNKPLVGVGALSVLAACGVLTWRQAGYWQDTERLFRHAAAVTKDNYTALANVGAALFARGELDGAISYCRKALEIKPDYADGLNNLGAAMEKKGSNESMDYYREALRINPGHSGALYNLGNAFIARGRHAEAAGAFEAVLQLKPDNLEARNNLANELLALGRIDEAIAQYRLALSRNPANDKVLKNLGAALVRKGMLDEAGVYYRRALKVEPEDGTAHYALGLVLALQGKWDEAIQHYTATVRLMPPNPEVEYNLGYAFRMSGRLAEAAAHLGEALRLRPAFPLAHYNLGCVLADRGQKDEAVVHLKEALRLKPDYKEARQKLDELGVQPGMTADKAGREQ